MLVGLLRSRSYYLTASPARRAKLLTQVQCLVDDHPELAGRAEVVLPYRTTVVRAQRRADSSPVAG
jgi:hypothetical protein